MDKGGHVKVTVQFNDEATRTFWQVSKMEPRFMYLVISWTDNHASGRETWLKSDSIYMMEVENA